MPTEAALAIVGLPCADTHDWRQSVRNDRKQSLVFLGGECRMVDPYQIRRDLIAIRSRHSANDAVTAPINKLLGKIAHIRQN
jgi:hypothetical protein